MKKLRIFLAIAATAFLGLDLSASHDMGGSITYYCLNACTTRVHFTGYRDCAAVGILGPFTFTWSGAPGCVPPTAIGGASPLIVQEITPICPTAVTQCTSPSATLYGQQQYSWYRDYDICAGTPCAYTINWSTCCRSAAITSISNPSGHPIWIQAGIHTGITPCNNSPQFLGPPLVHLFEGQNHILATTASDPDGDSLAFELGPCLGTNGAALPYASGYNQATAMGPTWNVTIDPLTGKINFQAVPGNMVYAVICVYVTEWRQGVLLGTVMRDFAVVVLPNLTTDTDPVVGTPFNVSPNVTTVGNHLYVCSASPVCFDITCSDVDAAQSLLMGCTHILPGATFTQAGSTIPVDTITGTSAIPPVGRFCWTPPTSGTYYVRFVAADDVCPVRGVSDQVVVIHVVPTSIQASATVVGCPVVQFSVTACGGLPMTYIWTGAGGFNSTSQNPVHTYPGPGVYPWQLIATDGFSTFTFNDTVVIPAGPSYQSFLSGVHYVAPCTGTLYDTLDAGSWAGYQWSNGDTTQQTVVYIGGTYGVTVTAPNGCMYHDSTELFWASPDIFGVVETSTGAPLQNQKILLIEHDTTLQALWAVDSSWTDSLGYYFFCNVTDTLVFLKATPSAFDYPNEMPTYADTTLFWNNAVTFYPQIQIPFQHDFATLFGTNPGGPGFIGGLVTQGANKTSAVGDPVPGLRVFLREANGGAILGHRVTNANGYFSFANVPLGDYEIVPDRPLVSTTNVPALTLTAQTPVMDSLDFQLHRYWLELMAPVTGTPTPGAGFSFKAVPNPFGNSTQLQLDLVADAEVAMDVYDVMGRQAASVVMCTLKKGPHRYAIGTDLLPGVYFVRLRVNGEEQTLKVLKIQ